MLLIDKGLVSIKSAEPKQKKKQIGIILINIILWKLMKPYCFFSQNRQPSRLLISSLSSEFLYPYAFYTSGIIKHTYTKL